ncbi:hypothetical protein M3I54_24815 [Paraburkholderia sp. CNPSo 3274]|uniref:hypothetical protein n=1 Tax=Paraburkholderia sp. CNPSo 3274 TaxID=2940932 RepID=UPI0020B68339|nr:hypothetical protein [Paraburkholderia sp. CNPSo 3274]MCP3710149.1 hypothetical protein [Paraburkholderia sp. CNPSo 3274]
MPVTQETADDVSLIWLKNHGDTAKAVSILGADEASGNATHIQTLYHDAALKAIWGDPAQGRVPDLIIQPIPGTIYSKSAANWPNTADFTQTIRTRCWWSPIRSCRKMSSIRR